MKRKIDLHIHTTFSDGEELLLNVLESYYQLGYDVISITDHDSIDAYNDITTLYKGKMRVLKGVEISSRYADREVHLLAYDFNINNSKLFTLLNNIKNSRNIRAKKMINKLNELGLDVTINDVLEVADSNASIGRPHIARALVNNGYFKHPQQAFNKYISDNGPAYVPKLDVSPKEVIDIVHQAGGFVVLAHPFKSIDIKNISYFVKAGIDGIETYYYDHSPKEIARCENICRDNNLISTGGSDFHGKLKHQTIGEYTAPDCVINELNKLLEERINL